MTAVAGPGKTTSSSGPVQAPRQASSGAGFSDLLRAASGKNGGSKTDSLDGIFGRASEAYGVPVNLLKAVARAESDFQADAVSSCGAQGIMQLMPSTAASLGVSDPFDPEQNIMGGAKYLGGLLSSYGGDAKLALAAYNAGSGNVKKYGGIPPFSETQNYVKRVLSYAGDDSSLTVPVSAQFSGGSPSVSSAADTVRSDTVPGNGLFFSVDDYQLFAKMYAEQMEQEALDRAEAASQVQESAELYRSVS